MALLLDKACDITPFADTESTRYALGGVFYDREHNALVATDSRVLAIVELPVREDIPDLPDAPNRNVVIPVRAAKDAIKDVRKTKTKNKSRALTDSLARREVAIVTTSEDRLVHIETNGDAGTTKRSVREVEGRFPKWADVLMGRDDFPHSFVMDPKYILKIAKFFADHGDDKGVLVRFSGCEGMLEFSGTVNGRKAYVVAMPMAEVTSKCADEPTAKEHFTGKKPKANR